MKRIILLTLIFIGVILTIGCEFNMYSTQETAKEQDENHVMYVAEHRYTEAWHWYPWARATDGEDEK